MAVDFTSWTRDPKAIRCVLVEVVANVSGSNVTRYLSTKNYTDEVAARIYESIVNPSSLQTIERMSVNQSPTMNYGDIEIINTSGLKDSWLRDIWVNKAITVLVGDVRWLRADFVTIFTGVIDDVDSRSADTVNLKLRDKLQRLNTPLSEVKLGGTTINKNEFKPLCFGETFNITPLFSNPATLEFQVHNGAVESIIEVRDNGVPVSATKTIGTGKFTLSQQPFGVVTASVQGSKPSTWIKTVSALVQHIVKTYGSSQKLVDADLDLVQLAAFESANTQPVGRYVDGRENTLVTCNAISQSVGAQLSMSRAGKLRLLKIEALPSGTPFACGVDDIVQNSMSITEKFPVRAAVKINYVKNWTVQDNLLTGIPEEHKKIYAQEFASVLVQDLTVKTNYAVDAEPEAIDTMLLKDTDASVEANRLLNIFKNPMAIITFTGMPWLSELVLGQAITITYPRFGFDFGTTGQVVGLAIDWGNLTVKVDVLISLIPSVAPTPSKVLREDGSFVLREDGSKVLRETV